MFFEIKRGEIYHAIYGKESGNRYYAERLAAYLEEQLGISVQACDDDAMHEREILIGACNRTAEKKPEGLSKGAFFSGVAEGRYVLAAQNGLGLTFAALHLIETVRAVEENGVAVLREDMAEQGRFDLLPRNAAYAEAVALANRLSGTFSNWGDTYFGDPNSTATPEMRADHALVRALVKRMGGSLALLDGSSSALLRGFVVKQDKNDYSRVTRVKNGHVWAVADFLGDYFGRTLPSDANGYADATAFCEANSSHTLALNEETGLAVITPADETSFLDPDAEEGGYTNGQYLARMPRFFHNPKMPEPQNNVEQSRRVIISTPPENEAKYFYHYVWHETDEGAEVVYSPAVLVREENGARVIYASYEYSVKGKTINLYTYLRRSEDDGETWETVARVERVVFGSLTEVNDRIYLIGNYAAENGIRMYVAEYDPITRQMKESVFQCSYGGGAPNTVLQANGRIFKAYNKGIASAELGADLLREESWRFSNDPGEFFTRELFERIANVKTRPLFGVEEGNVVQAPDGSLWVIYRITASPSMGYVAIYRLSADGAELSVGPEEEFITKFPYTQSKFSMVYDQRLQAYVTLTSLSTLKHTGQRNVLGLVVGKDLWHWEIVDVLLIDREMLDDRYSLLQHAFQYVDFVTAGDDLYFAVREASGDCFWSHENNCATLYRIPDYVNFIRSRLDGKTERAKLED